MRAHGAYHGVGDIDHKHGKIGTVVDWRLLHRHAIFQAPVLFRIPEITLDLETQPIIVYQLIIGKCSVTTEQYDVSHGLRLQIGFHHHHNIEQISKFLMP